MEDGLLLREGHIVLPDSLQMKILRLAHVGHPGMVCMKRQLQETYWWSLLDLQVEQSVCCCEGCQMSAKSQSPDPIPQIAIPKPDKPWSRLGLDIAGPYHTAPQH